MMVDAEFPKPIRGFVDECVLYDMDSSKTGKIPCTVFAFTSYKNRAPTVKILLDDGALFSFVPLHKVYHYLQPEDSSLPILGMQELCYRNCPEYDIVLSSPKFLQGEVLACFHTKELWMDARYVASIDWHTHSLVLHFLMLENGQFATLPSHKVKFRNQERAFKPYRKLSVTWEV